ncbi:MAG: PQQ-binding-like beta-propeller repeat protein [Armatimonadota bacterium]
MKVSLVVVCMALAVTAFAAEWSQILGPNQDSIAPDTGINKNWNDNPPQKLWQVSLSDNGYAGPSVADGKVFIIDHSGSNDIVRAFNLQNGQEVWRYSYADAAKHNYGFARATPTYDEGRLYTISRTGNVHCLNASDGSVVWSMNMKSQFDGQSPKWDYAASAFIDGSKLILCPGGNRAPVVALNKMDESTIWTGGASGMAGYATPKKATLQGTEQYVIFTADKLTGVRASDGQVMWTFPWPTKYGVNAATPVIGGDYIFINTDYGKGCGLIKITDNGAEKVWTNTAMQSHFNSAVFYNGYVFGIGNPGFLVCLYSHTGEVMWQERGFERGGLIAVDGTLIALDGKGGDLVMVEATADEYRELGRMKPLGGQSWTAPIIADGKLIIRNKNAMCCLDLK